MARKWQKVGRSHNQLFQRETTWLEQIIYNNINDQELPDNQNRNPGLSRPIGRPRVPFKDASNKTKKRRVTELASRPPEELVFAAECVSVRDRSQVSACFTAIEALALMLDLDISVRKYIILRSVINAKANNCLPSYFQLKETKKAILPSNIILSDTSAEVDLQEIL